ncbi:MAG: redoxin domain-containing protein [Candidatus Omnitrophica bacterium]|nr:redoxin domain-containing protein [Candidatus Omnitrophota bacterium]
MQVFVRSVILFFIVAFSVAGFSGKTSAQGFFDHPLRGKAAPNIVLEKLEGGRVGLIDQVKGKQAIVFFWATWCPHCREQIQALNARRSELEKAGIMIEFVDVGEPKGQVKAFLKDHQMSDNVFLDIDTQASEAYSVYGIPTLYFIGRDGIVHEALNEFPDNFEKILGQKP